MVALAGSTWKLAPCLVRLFREADALFPGRPTGSDGTIGDAGHSARASDHNPDDDEKDADTTLWVCAADLTDAIPGPVAFDLLEHLRAVRDQRVKYGISEGKAFYSYANSAHPAWEWVPYSGPNGHFSHGHISVHNTAAARDDLSGWFDFAPIAPPPEDPFMALSDAEQAQLLRAVMETREIAEHNRWNRDVLDGISQAVSKIAAGDGASATEILDALAARLAG